MQKKKYKKKTGAGLIDSIINKLPVEMHVPGYRFCGPGTKLEKRIRKGQSGINKLDDACKRHDITYTNYLKGRERYDADKLLAKEAWGRVKSKDASLGEKATALAVAGIMKAKTKLAKIGSGLKKKKLVRKKRRTKKVDEESTTKAVLREAVQCAKNKLRVSKPNNVDDATKMAINAAKAIVKSNKALNKRKDESLPRVIPVPKIGGVLPLIPIFAGLSALGALVGGSAAVANAVMTTNNAKKELVESKRHNQMMEAVAIGKNKYGKGLYLKPYKNGLGLYTTKKINSKNF